MRTLIIGFIVFLAWAVGCRYWYVCKIQEHCGTVQVDDDVRAKTMNLKHNDGTMILEGYDQFRFDTDSAAGINVPVVPILNANNDDFLSKVAAQLKANPKQKVKIYGHFLPSEAGTSYDIWENLGQARANAIRDKLIALGVDKNQLAIDFKQEPDGTTSLSEPISFALSGEAAALADNDSDADDNGKDSGKDSEDKPEDYGNDSDISFENMTYSDANFEKNSAVFTPGDAFQAYAKKVKEYLDQEENKGKKLLIVGHTCDLGSDKHNMNLGRKRAKAAREYFKKMGISTEIGVESDGETNPLSDYPNTSETNRSRNRRVNIQIK